MEDILHLTTLIIDKLSNMELDEKIYAINEIRRMIHEESPFNTEPVDFIYWAKNDLVHSNDYNPNSVAPPEMELLRLSINADGYTQPIVTFKDDLMFEVVDGFHRNRVGKEFKDIRDRIHGYLPVVQIRESREDKGDRIAATIRHNRARGKHKIDAMSEIVLDLKKRNWSDEKIGRELGMDADEVLRLAQISGLAEAFSNVEFSEAWEADGWDDSETLNQQFEQIDE